MPEIGEQHTPQHGFAPAGGWRTPLAWLRRRHEDSALRRALNSDDFSAGEMPLLLRKPGCPVCRSILERLRQFLFWYREEVYNSGEWTARMVRTWGFCQQHSWELVAADCRHELTFMAQYLSRQAQEQIGDLAGALRHERHAVVLRFIGDRAEGAASALTPSEICSLCALLADDENDLQDLLRVLRDPAAAADYAAGDGLCLPHLSAAIAQLKRAESPLIDDLLTAQRQLQARRLEGFAGSAPTAAMHAVQSIVGRRFALREALHRLDAQAESDSERDLRLQSAIDHAWVRQQLPAGASLCELASLPGCSLCRLRERHRYEFDQHLLISGKAAVADLARLCRIHAWELVGCDSERELAPAWRAVLRLRFAEATGAEERAGCGAASEGPCPACLSMDAADADAIRQAGEASCAGFGPKLVCIPHLRLLTGRVPRRVSRQLATHLSQVFEVLAGEVDEYFRKLDYRYSHEPRGHEQSAGLRTVALLSGPPPLFRERSVERLSGFGGWTYLSPRPGGQR